MIPDSNPSRPPEEFIVQNIHFIGEQDGPPERELKTHLKALFANEPGVQRAYLARLQFDDRVQWDVALCLLVTNSDFKELSARIGRVFAAMFKPNEHLDVIFLSDVQERSVSKVCVPFYGSRQASGTNLQS